jgi:hypothetical protein
LNVVKRPALAFNEDFGDHPSNRKTYQVISIEIDVELGIKIESKKLT